MELFLLVMFGILGMCFGSFVNMWTYRITNYELRITDYKNTNKKRSFCDYCGRQLRWFENIPAISWIVLNGTTNCCRKKLPVSYPLIELGMGLLFAVNYQLQINSFELGNGQFWLGLLALVVAMVLIITDIKYMILPEVPLYMLVALGLIKVITEQSWINFAVGVGLFGIFWLLSKLKIKGREAMGDGDAYVVLFMGWWLGVVNVIVGLYLAFILGAMYGLPKLWNKKSRLSPIPFGPFLLLGWWVADNFGGKLLYYLNIW